MKKDKFFCIFGISTHLAFLGSNFSCCFLFFYHFFIPDLFFIFLYQLVFVFWLIIVLFSSFLFISHHFLRFSHGFLVYLVFCNIFDQQMRKKWRTLRKIQGFWKNDKNMIKNMMKIKNKWKKLDVFFIFGISTHLAFLGSNFSFFLFFEFALQNKNKAEMKAPYWWPWPPCLISPV